MAYYPDIVEQLIEKLKKLPGIGPKGAERIVSYFLKCSEEKVLALAENLNRIKKEVKLCERCFNLSENNLCQICKDTHRENILCIVEEVKDLIVIEKTGYKGIYHVLGGRISTLDNINPEDLHISQLITRLKEKDIKEVIIATNPNPEGEDTAVFISNILKKLGVKHSRIAYGLPVGSEIEYIDTATLKKSIEGRKTL